MLASSSGTHTSARPEAGLPLNVFFQFPGVAACQEYQESPIRGAACGLNELDARVV